MERPERIVLIIIGALFVVVTVAMSGLLSPSKPSAEKSAIYECGEAPVEPRALARKIARHRMWKVEMDRKEGVARLQLPALPGAQGRGRLTRFAVGRYTGGV